MRLRSAVPLLMLVFAAAFAGAQEPALPEAGGEGAATPGPTGAELRQQEVKRLLAEYGRGNRSLEMLSELLPYLADPAALGAVRAAVEDPLPAAHLVTLLKYPALSVRLGALELLEEKAGGDFGFNPWNPPQAPENDGALARWARWAAEDAGKTGRTKGRALLGEDQRRGYLRDLLGQDDDKAARARHMLEADGLGSVGFLEDFLAGTPALAAGARSRVRQAQYQIVLSPRLGPSAGEVARNLAFGSRDQLLAALATAKGAGQSSLPILRDFIDHADPLVRETAIDSILASGGAGAAALVAPVLAKEPDVNVIHGALRRLKDIPGEASLKLAASFLTHPDEDLLVSAIQACLKLSGGGSSHGMTFGKSSASKASEGEERIIAALADPRWRVRVAALEYVLGRKVSKASDQVLKLLDDPDEFVRFAAIKTSCGMGIQAALPKLKQAFLANEAMAGPVLEGYGALGSSPDKEMLDHLAKSSPEARVAAIRAAESNRSMVDLAMLFAGDPDLDVSCAALRFLGADPEKVGRAQIASLLVQGMRSGSREKREAVMARLALPPNKTTDPALARILGTLGERPEKTTLDPLYDDFLKPLQVGAAQGPDAGVVVFAGAQGLLVEELGKLAADDADKAGAFAAAMVLARSGHPSGFTALTRMLPHLSTAQKAAVGDNIHSPGHRAAVPLLEALLKDPVAEIREAAASCALSNDDAPVFVKLVFDELSRPGSPLQPHEVYGYRFESAARSRGPKNVMTAWAMKVLQDAQSRTALKILACICLREAGSGTTGPLLLGLVKGSPDAGVRRAAAQALGWSRPGDWKSVVDEVSKDKSPYVREVVPAVANRSAFNWSHRFDDVHVTGDDHWSSSSDSCGGKDPAVSAALERLAAPSETSPVVRFEAMFALMASGKPVDVEAMVGLLRQQPAESGAPGRIAEWFSESSGQVGPGLQPLFAVIDSSRIDERNMATLKKRLQLVKGGEETAPVSFSALASAVPVASAEQQVAPAESEVAAKVERTSLPLVFFKKTGCNECERVREMLDKLKRDFPKLEVEEHNIMEADAIVLNQALSERMQVPSLKHGIAPSLFTQAGFLITTDIDAPSLAALLVKTQAVSQDDSWKVIETRQIEAAKEQVADRYRALTLPVVIGAGLLDGVNPCAFATIIFFLSYLQIARRSRNEMLMTGAAFILGVFLAYLAAGLVLYQVLAELHARFAGIKIWLNPLFAGLALVAAGLSFRDAVRARSGRMDEMTLQLPGFLKDRIRGVIRTGARARRFVIAAFLMGIAISFLELACTGQVYAPIVYQIQQGKMDAVGMLVLYNLAFILPLVVIFILAYCGLRSETLIALQKKHTFVVKAAFGVLFVVLAVFILFGEKMLH